MLNGHLFSGYLRAGPPLALPGPQNIDPVRHPFGQILPPAMLAPAAALRSVVMGAGRLRAAPLRTRPSVLMAGPFDGLFGALLGSGQASLHPPAS